MSKIQTKWIADLAVQTAKIDNDAVDSSKLDETDDYTFTGTIDVTGGTLTAASPSGDNDVATKGYTDSIAAGLTWKDPVVVRAQGNITLSGPGASIDGIPMSLDDRVLCDQQSTPTEDGIYLWKGAAVAMVRSSDAQAGSDFAGASMVVEQGTDADIPYMCTNDKGSGILGTDNIVMQVFPGAALPHDLGGSKHNADTLANLNSKISDGTVVDKDTANTWSEKQTFQSGAATDSPVKLDPMASDPSSLGDGDIWAVTSGRAKVRSNGVTRSIDEEIKTEMHKVTAGEVTAGYFTLSSNPVNAQSVRASVVGGIPQVNKQVVGATGATPDFDILSTNQFNINNNGAATGLSGDIAQDDILIIAYQT